MKVLAFDTETTGFLEEGGKVVEIAMVIYDTVIKRIINAQSYLVNSLDPEEGFTPGAAKVNGLNIKITRDYGIDSIMACVRFFSTARGCDCYAARNGVFFDIPMMKNLFRDNDTEWHDLPCIDDLLDFTYSDKVTATTLSYIAADLGFVNPFPHVGLGDVMTMLKCWEIENIDWEDALDSAKHPGAKVLGLQKFPDNNLARNHKFRFDKNTKQWIKLMRMHKAETAIFPFETKIIN